MALAPRLDLRQSQSLVMTPQLQQAIKLLQLNNVELTTYVEQELERNPLLERAEPEPDQAPEREDSRADARDDTFVESASGGASETPLDVDYDNSYTSASSQDLAEAGVAGGRDAGTLDSWGRGGRSDFGDDRPDLEQTLSGDVTLQDHLTQQLTMDIADPIDRVIGEHLIDMVDERGWLSGDPADLALRLGTDIDRVDSVLRRMQRFDPPGILARTLAECLRLQLEEVDRFDPFMARLLDHLDMLGKHDFQGLMKICGVDAEDMAEMIDEIRALNPRPASAFDVAPAQPVTPDVLMRPRPDGGWLVELNSDTLPRVLVNTHYYAEVSKVARSKDDKSYLTEQYQTANWLVKSLHQRATTILKVASEIVRQQERFFARGVEHLRPLVLRDIAEVIEMHESTVSRVTANKYISTPRGLYELKYFFTQAIASSTGADAHSAESVRHRIKAMIDAEPPKKVLSDDKIVEILKAEGVDIARRTVAKYREGMRIPSSVHRRREKSLRS